MKTYRVPAYRDDYGYITIKAKSKSHAMQLVEQSEWSDEMYEVKGGECGLDTVCTKEDIILLD